MARLSIASVVASGAALTSGQRIAPAFRSLIWVQVLGRRAAGADANAPLFLSDVEQPVPAEQERSWLTRIARDTRLDFGTALGFRVRDMPCRATVERLDPGTTDSWGEPSAGHRTLEPITIVAGLSMAIWFSQLRPSFLPTGGHGFSPLVAIKSPHRGVPCGVRSGASPPCRRLLGRVGSCLGRR